MTDTSAEAVERLISYAEGRGNTIIAATLRALLAECDMWRSENAKKQAACEQMGAWIAALEAERDATVKVRVEAIKRMKAAEAERDRLRNALLQIASSGVDGENLNLSHVGHAGCINVAQNAIKENDQ